jgi:hypothetical protein
MTPGGSTNRRYAAERTALVTCQQAQVMSSGKSLADLQAMSLSGTHLFRKMASTVAKLAKWPEEEINVLGDWAPASDPEKGKKKGKSSAVVYHPDVSLREQCEVRTRYALLLQTAFAVYGIGNVTWETTWEDLLPFPPPADLEQFYFKRKDDRCPGIRMDASASWSFNPGAPAKRGAPRRVGTKRAVAGA